MYTVEETAKLLGITHERVRQLLIEYGFGNQKFGQQIIITEEELEALKSRPTRRGRRSRQYPRRPPE